LRVRDGFLDGYRHVSRQAALRAQYETAATGIRAEFLAEVARLQAGEGEA